MFWETAKYSIQFLTASFNLFPFSTFRTIKYLDNELFYTQYYNNIVGKLTNCIKIGTFLIIRAE